MTVSTSRFVAVRYSLSGSTPYGCSMQVLRRPMSAPWAKYSVGKSEARSPSGNTSWRMSREPRTENRRSLAATHRPHPVLVGSHAERALEDAEERVPAPDAGGRSDFVDWKVGHFQQPGGVGQLFLANHSLERRSEQPPDRDREMCSFRADDVRDLRTTRRRAGRVTVIEVAVDDPLVALPLGIVLRGGRCGCLPRDRHGLE